MLKAFSATNSQQPGDPEPEHNPDLREDQIRAVFGVPGWVVEAIDEREIDLFIGEHGTIKTFVWQAENRRL